MKIILAKTGKQGEFQLWEHTLHVVQAIEVMAQAYGFPVELARKGAVLHDLGKGHPAFQAMLIEKPKEDQEEWLAKLPAADAIREELYYRADGRVLAHRHELSSLLFLPLFPQEEWPILTDMVVAHHKSVIADKRERGLLDLVQNEGGIEPVLERHIEAWDEWSPVAAKVLEKFGYSSRLVSYDEAVDAFNWVYQYVQGKSDGWSTWRGLLMGADHFGSAYKYEAEQVVKPLFQLPSLDYFVLRTQTPQAALYPLTQVRTNAKQRHTLVAAPTGAGKTDFLIRRCEGRIFYTLPFQASINAMYQRMRAALPEADVRRLHAASRIELEDESAEDVELQLHPGAALKVMTPHQLSSIVFGTPGHEMLALDLRGHDVILDEVHTYDKEARAMIVQMVRTLVRLGCHVHIGTATIPSALAHVLIESLGGSSEVYEVRLGERELASFNRHTVHKLPDETAARALVQEKLTAGEHILFVGNRVKTAQERYQWVKETFGEEIPALLIHSRFKREDRKKLEKEVLEYQHLNGPCIICATQVIEVSLDISFDRMITDAAPIDSLIQRFGRVNRIRNAETIGTYKPVHVIAPPESNQALKPYEPEVVRTSYEVLPNGELLEEIQVQALIDQVYPEIAVPNTETHFAATPSGEYRIRELQHKQRSVIVEALKIEGGACILQSEADLYMQTNWQERPSFEIPVRADFGMIHQLGPPLEYGAYPWLIPDEWYHPNGLPLGLMPQDKETNESFSKRAI